MTGSRTIGSSAYRTTTSSLKSQLRVGVLMGGPSSEHAISLKSGHGVVEALTGRGWDVRELVIPKELSAEQALDATTQLLEQQEIHVAFITLHGPFGEDGTVQQLCEGLQIPYTGSGVEASRLGLDKVASRRRFEQAGLIVPRWRLLQSTAVDQIDRCIEMLRFPLVVKPTNQGSSIGISIARHHAELLEAVECASQYDARLLLEEFVPGREVTVGVLGDEALPIVEIKPHQGFFDFTAKYTPGQTDYLAPAPLDNELAKRVQQAGLTAHRVIGCRHFSRADLLLDRQQRPVVLEVNTIPGFTATSLLPKAAACVGIDYAALCERIIEMAVAASPSTLASAPKA